MSGMEKLGSTEEMEERKVVNAGDVGEDGIVFKPETLMENENEEYGKFWSLECVLIEGEEKIPAVLNFGGVKLHNVVEESWEEIEGERVLLRAFGEDFDRYYELYLV